MSRRGSAVLVLVAALLAARPVAAGAPSKYEVMVEQIGALLGDAVGLYKKGNVQGAKLKTQSAYFEVFENLEGPIRVNISAKANYELEEEFSAIRKMILRKEPAAAIEERVGAFMERLRGLLPELEGGVELKAESEGARERAGPAEAGPGGVLPVWLTTADNIELRLGQAVDVYRKGDADEAAALVSRALSEEYTSSLLEVAIRGNLSQRRNFEHVSAFSDLEGMIRAGADAAGVAAGAAALVGELRKDLPGLPMVEGAAAKRLAPKAAERRAAGRDWSRVTAASLGAFFCLSAGVAIHRARKRQVRNMGGL